MLAAEPISLEPHMPPEVWRLVEYRLRHYREYLDTINRYEAERALLAEPNMTSHVGAAVQHGIGRPVELQALRLQALARTRDDAAWHVRAIDFVLGHLSAFERRMVERIYFEGATPIEVARDLACTDRTLRKLRKPVIISFAEQMGLL